jgi:hypothetical protein
VALLRQLDDANGALWTLEDRVRVVPTASPEFVETASAIPTWNDRRAAIKREIDARAGSAIASDDKVYNLH